MSILLDSLKQKKDDDGMVVPSVHDSHFDDEMLNDDELTKSNQFWKLTSVFLFITLSISWIYFYLDISKNTLFTTNKSTRLTESKSENEESKKLSKLNKKVADVEENYIELNREPAQLVNDENSDSGDKSRNNQYEPQKRVVAEDGYARINYGSKNTAQQKKSNDSNDFSNKLYSSEDAVFYEELSTVLLMDLPNLEIDSYAVSSNPKKSFIVLNGSFYSEGEAISPNLKLLSIDKKNVLFKYKNQLIKKNYK